MLSTKTRAHVVEILSAADEDCTNLKLGAAICIDLFTYPGYLPGPERVESITFLRLDIKFREYQLMLMTKAVAFSARLVHYTYHRGTEHRAG